MATKYRTCHLCEATCGLTLEVEGNRVVSAKGDPDDSFSRGYLCPKGAAIGKLHEDPDKLKQPMKRKPDGTFEPIGWDEAYRLAGEGLSAVVRKHGRHALAHYIGNPVVHHVGALYGSEQWREVSGSRNRYTANSQDVNPHLVANTTMFGMQFAQPVPDLSRSKLLVIMGANPLASNGSLMTAPGMGRRLRDIQKRGGRVLVIDPRRSETAAIADEHWPIRPGTDALLLLAIAQTLLAEGLTDTEYLARYTRGTGGLGGLLEPFAPEHVVVRLGGKITADAIKALARDLAARKGYVYGRLGMCLSPFAGLTCWGLKLVNLLTGSIDREGGALFAEGLASHLFDLSFGRGSYDRYRSPQGAPEVNAEYPCHILADQIERGLADPKAPEAVFGMVTICGNPVLSAPNGPRIAAAFTKLEFMVSVDIYLSETARLADLVLPPRSSLYDPQFDPVFQQVAVESYARWSEPVFDAKEHGVTQPSEFELLTRLTHEVFSRAPRAGFKGKRKGFRAWLGTKLSVEGISDLLIRTGPRGDRFLLFSEGLNLKKLRKAEHGLPTEPLRAGRLASKIKHPDGRIDLAPAVYRADLPRLLKEL
ncbi:MAG: molybdopterin-dependent oxidoreductase, partial [Planctomycetota bacterium]